MALRDRSLNERLTAAAIIKQILLMRFSLHVRDLVTRALNNTEHPIAALVREAIWVEAGLRDPTQVVKLNALIDQINSLRRTTWNEVTTTVEDSMSRVAEAEPEDERNLFGLWLPGLKLTLPMLAVVAAQAVSAQFQGRNLRTWLTDAADDEARRIRQAVYVGVGAGESAAAVARRIVGTSTAQGRDGATQVSRNYIDAIVRSATTHVSAYARDQFRRANEAAETIPADHPNAPSDSPRSTKVFTLEQFVAVLDSRTTKLCRGLDGRRYKIGEGPIPPLHVNCRSMRVLVLPDSLGGPLYDPGTYAKWIRQQPDVVQALILGSTKDAKLSQSDVDLGAFRDYGARPMTLDSVRDEAKRVMESY